MRVLSIFLKEMLKEFLELRQVYNDGDGVSVVVRSINHRLNEVNARVCLSFGATVKRSTAGRHRRSGQLIGRGWIDGEKILR